MTAVLRKLLEVPSDTPIEIAGKRSGSVGLVEIPEIFIDNTDRNRTSPFAFTGNRFEFRAVGSSANCAGAMTTLNAAVAEQLLAFKADVDKAMAAGKPMNIAVMDTLKPIIRSIIDVICFDGNGYSDEWKAEAQRRGLDVESSVPEMFKAFTTPKAVSLFTSLGIYSEKELHARNEVKWETYTKKVQIEARVMGRMALNHIIPAALAYQTRLLQNVRLWQEVGGKENTENSSVAMEFSTQISELVTRLKKQVDDMVNARKAANKIEDEYLKAKAYHEIAESLASLRRSIDKLEEIVDNDLWPLPKYRELLFIN
jgi:glutamine synthetase